MKPCRSLIFTIYIASVAGSVLYDDPFDGIQALLDAWEVVARKVGDSAAAMVAASETNNATELESVIDLGASSPVDLESSDLGTSVGSTSTSVADIPTDATVFTGSRTTRGYDPVRDGIQRRRLAIVSKYIRENPKESVADSARAIEALLNGARIPARSPPAIERMIQGRHMRLATLTAWAQSSREASPDLVSQIHLAETTTAEPTPPLKRQRVDDGPVDEPPTLSRRHASDDVKRRAFTLAYLRAHPEARGRNAVNELARKLMIAQIHPITDRSLRDLMTSCREELGIKANARHAHDPIVQHRLRIIEQFVRDNANMTNNGMIEPIQARIMAEGLPTLRAWSIIDLVARIRRAPAGLTVSLRTEE